MAQPINHIHEFEKNRHRLISFADTASIDGAGRMRVSSPSTLFEAKQISDELPLFFDDQEVSGGGTSSNHSTDTASTILGVSASTAGKRIKQTFRRFNYGPGKSLYIGITGNLGTDIGTGHTAEVIYGDDNNAFGVINSAGTLKILHRTSTSGSPVDSSVSQNASDTDRWNIDPMDGTGPSKINLTPENVQLVVIDMVWLSVSRVRIGFVIAGKIYYVHQFITSNIATIGFTSTPNLPIRWSIENDGSGGAATLTATCAVIASEGGVERLGISKYYSVGNSPLAADVAGTTYALLGFRLKSTHLDRTVMPLSISLYPGTADAYEWKLIVDPTVASTFSYSSQQNSSIQLATGATANTITGGTVIAGGYGSSSGANRPTLVSNFENELIPGSYIDGTPQEFVLAITPLGSGTVSLSIYGGLTLQEL